MAPTTGRIRCEILGDAPFANGKLIVIRDLPEYHADMPFFVLADWIKQENEGPAIVVNIVRAETGGEEFVVDVPGEPLNFGPRLVVPTERIATTN